MAPEPLTPARPPTSPAPTTKRPPAACRSPSSKKATATQAQPGDVVRVHYRGLLGDGTVFDSSEGRDAFRFPLGQGAVISGWDEGIGLLSEGGRALLVIPPDLGYGATGSGGVIPPNATLYFEVELVEVLEGGPDEPVDVSESDYETTASGLQYYVVEEGDGDMPEDGQPVRVHFTYWLDDGTRLESSLDAGEPFLMTIGSEQLPDGLNEALAMMRVGEQTQFIIPPDLAFGEQDLGSIPPNSTLIFSSSWSSCWRRRRPNPLTSTRVSTRPTRLASRSPTSKKAAASRWGRRHRRLPRHRLAGRRWHPHLQLATSRASPSSCPLAAVRPCPAGMKGSTGCVLAASAR
jgi:peptidylprolyl isomerase